MRIILAFSLLNTIGLITSTSGVNDVVQFVAGYQCAAANFPYVVSIETVIIYRHVCGGSLIGPKWVLSAAHCEKGDGEKHVVIAGLSALMYGISLITSDFIQESEVHQWYVHPDYSELGLVNDVCLLKLKRAIDQSPVIKRVSLYLKELPRSFESDCSNSLVLGFGSKRDRTEKLIGREKIASNLRCANVSVLPDVECNFLAHQTQFCAMDKGSDVECVNPGDSGGPLFCNDEQIGIVSGYNPLTKHSFFVKVYLYKDFIYGTMASNSCTFYLSMVCVFLVMFALRNKMP